jgi:hypothetical protein
MGSSSSNPQKVTVERDEVSGTVKVVLNMLFMLLSKVTSFGSFLMKICM